MLGFQKKSSSLLAKQNITKKQHKKNPKKIKPFYKYIILILALPTTIYFLQKKLRPKEGNPSMLPWSHNIIISSDTQTVLSNEQYKNIMNSFKDISSFDVTNYKLAKQIQEKSIFSQVTIYQTTPQNIHIHIKERTALLSISADKHRLISNTGEIYGNFQKNLHNNLVIVKNIFPKNRKIFTFLPNNSLQLNKDEKELLKDCLLIYNLAKKNELKLKEINFIRHRGFSISIKNAFVKIILGRRPFEKKFSKLLKIMENNKNSQQDLSLIELDFDGKAFIKKKNPKNMEKT